MVSIEDLKKTKKAKKMTLQEISDLSHIPKRTVDDIFSGHTKNPRIDTLEAIAKALGLSSENEKKPVATSYEPSEKEKKLLTAFGQLIPSLQDYLIETAEKLVQASSGTRGNAQQTKTRRA